jgi:hypothetical protein
MAKRKGNRPSKSAVKRAGEESLFTAWPAKALLIIVAAFAIYWPALNGGWLWDDDLLLYGNALVHAPDGWWKIWFEPQKLVDYFPLSATAEWAQWQIFGPDTTGYHVVNVALHASGALLVWWLLRKFGLRFAWLGGLLFAVHPVMVESVAWMSELKNTLSLPLALLTLGRWIEWNERGRRIDYLRALVLFLAAMLAKPTMATFPLVFWLYAWWRRGRITRADVVQSLPFLAIALVLGLVTICYQLPDPAHSVEPVELGGPLDRLALAGSTLVSYVSKSVVPVGLFPIYPRWPVTPLALTPWLTWLAVGLVIGAAWRARAGWGRHVLLGFGFFLLTIAPFLGFHAATYMQFTWVMDHILYLPIVGLIALAVAGYGLAVERAPRTVRPWIYGTAALVMGAMLLGSRSYARVFQNQGTLWSYAATGDPDSPEAQNNLGLYYMDQQNYALAIGHYREAIRLKPGYAFAHNGLGNALWMANDIAGAAAEYRAAVRINPTYAEAYNGLANTLVEQGQLEAARAECERSIAADPAYSDPLCTLGLIDAREGKLPQAYADFERAHELSPHDGRITDFFQQVQTQYGLPKELK